MGLTTAVAFYLALAGLAPIGQSDSTLSRRTGAPLVRAVRVTGEMVLDGTLSEPGWATALPVSDFTQRDPQEGAPATERTEVRILYDDNALYVGARLYDRSPDSVRAQLARLRIDDLELLLDA